MTSFSGENGVKTFKAIALKNGLKLYARTGMKPNRAWTPSAMLQAAGALTGKVFKRGQYDAAIAALDEWLSVNATQHG